MTVRPFAGPLLWAAMAACLLGGATAQAQARYRFDTTPGVLPKIVLPRAYRIDLRPDLRSATFTADEEIDINVAQATAVLVLNAAGLDLKSVTLAERPDEQARVEIDSARQTATLRFATTVAVGVHTLKITYAGPITPQPAGLYYNDYATPAGARRMLVTQFEATDARRMFPGWDEPAFKATFTLSVVVPRSLVAISNTPASSEVPAGRDRLGRALKKVTFATTPSMSTYLVALLAGDLEAVRARIAGVDIGVWAVAGKSAAGAAALADASELLPYFNDYFGVDYPLPKLDLVAVPGNFDAGAMENWGAITFIDDALLYDPARSSELTREEVYATVAHEMAHQWSGDLVTMAWWDNLWLNEGFASWMENKSTDHFRPAWQVWLRTHADKERAMASDARSTTHAIQAPVANESEAKTLFDDITYLKGAQVIRMLETYLGEDAFRDGMRHYMKRHAYSNATTADLWAELEAASGRSVAPIASSFTEQPGVPLVSVSSRCVDGQTRLELTQQRFTLHDDGAAPATWRIPVIAGLAGSSGPPQSLVLGEQPQALAFDGCELPVKVNLGDVGYYRVAYDEPALRALRDHYPMLAAADRVSLLADQWAFVESGRTTVGPYLSLVAGISAETELVVWTDVLASVAKLDRSLRGTADQAPFRDWARSVVRPVLARLGWQPRAGEPDGDVLLRGAVIQALVVLEDPEVLAMTRQRFAAFLKDPASLPPSLRDAVFDSVGRQADQATFDRLRALGRRATDTEEKLRYYVALSRAQDPKFVPQICDIALSTEIAPARAALLVHVAAESGPDPELVWREVLARRDALLAKVTDDQRERMLPGVAGATLSPEVGAQLLAQPRSSADSGSAYEARRAVERIQASAEFAARVSPQVREFLAHARAP